MGIITENKEKYIRFNVDVIVDSYTDDSGKAKDRKIQLGFIDDLRLMASSLDSLTNNLVKDGRKLTGFDCRKAQYELLIFRGVYPYMDSWSSFDETQLPLKEAFYGNLSMSDISYQDYSHAQKIWADLGIRNMGEYHDFYL